jgi:hypothetical protein
MNPFTPIEVAAAFCDETKQADKNIAPISAKKFNPN